MSSRSSHSTPVAGDPDTPEEVVVEGQREGAEVMDSSPLHPPPGKSGKPVRKVNNVTPDAEGEDEGDEVFEDASEDGEVFLRKPRQVRPPIHLPAPPTVRSRVNLKPDSYDGTTDWSEYQIYFEQLAELNCWDDYTKAMTLGVSLRGEARMVLASLDFDQRHRYHSLVSALAQSFSPKERVHLYQAELKARRRKGEESIADLGRDIARLVRHAYPQADSVTREVVGINAFLDALPGPASEMKLHVIKGRPETLQEAVAHATEVDAVMEAEARKSSKRRGDIRVVDTEAEEKIKKLEQLCKELEKSLESSKRENKEKRKREVVCYGCREKGHYKRDCPHEKASQEKSQGNGSARLDHSQ